MVPGLGANGGTYRLALEPLSEHFEIRTAEISLDFPPVVDWSFFEAAIDDATTVWDSFQLLGHSLGGAIALHYAATHPKVSKVVVSSPVLFPFTRKLVPFRRVKGFFKGLSSGHPGHFFEALHTRRAMLAGGRAAKYYRFAGRIDLTEQLAQLPPATVLYPKHEEVIPFSHFERLQREYPHIKTRIIPGAHNDLALNPRRLVHIVREELDG